MVSIGVKAPSKIFRCYAPLEGNKLMYCFRLQPVNNQGWLFGHFIYLP
jgi:hypothetical protein